MTLTTVDGLIAAGFAAETDRAALAPVAARYAIAIPDAMLNLIAVQDTDGPIARQFVPDPRELDRRPDELADPIGDHAHSPVPGLVHRYPDRVLLKLTSVCPVYCRFCFRREMVGPTTNGLLSRDELGAAFAYVAATPAIWEVIVTGGDPLAVSPRRIAQVTRAVEAIGHVKVLRWHSRVPVVTPKRVTDDLAAALSSDRLAVIVGVHANHASELTPVARAALSRLSTGGISLVSQTVLLKGINDDPDTMASLMRGFVEAGVRPYYLHHADLAPGTSHFRTTIAEGRDLMRALRGRLSGIAQPIYVIDIPGGAGKVPIGPDYVTSDGIIDYEGGVTPYLEQERPS